ncbi:MAG TPA: formate dehydrogenase accessory protein FdhE [Candidatus Binatia bacterium]|nr:formate dehydrogenase accessory protein FdhE [Candidatus Binatia bacterium]
MAPTKTLSPWQRRVQRAHELSQAYPFAAEILDFYIHVAEFQEKLSAQLNGYAISQSELDPPELDARTATELATRFGSFLSLSEKYGPVTLAETTRPILARGEASWSDLLRAAWADPSPTEAEGFLAQAFLQPYAEMVRAQTEKRPLHSAYAICPFCNRKPSHGVMRQMGDGASRSLVCSFCLNEWDFRRIVCPGCGEENERKLSVFSAENFRHIRVEGCETCKTYLKSIDLTKDGHAEPLVDELASAPLDLWARERGYAKLHASLLGM